MGEHDSLEPIKVPESRRFHIHSPAPSPGLHWLHREETELTEGDLRKPLPQDCRFLSPSFSHPLTNNLSRRDHEEMSALFFCPAPLPISTPALYLRITCNKRLCTALHGHRALHCMCAGPHACRFRLVKDLTRFGNEGRIPVEAQVSSRPCTGVNWLPLGGSRDTCSSSGSCLIQKKSCWKRDYKTHSCWDLGSEQGQKNDPTENPPV